MSIFKDISSTVKNIFSAEDDMVFDDENDFKEAQVTSKPILPFGKKKQDEKNPFAKMPLPSFDPTNHDFNMSQSREQRKVRSNGRIQVYVPKTFEEAFNIIKDVKSGFTAMVNVEVANPQVAQRIVDLISGAIYALDGDCKKMGEKQYIFSLSTETVGAYDYLPVNGVKSQDPNANFNFNMGQPFDFLNHQNQNVFNPVQQPQSFVEPQSFVQQPQSQTPASDMKQFYVPPMSQF